MLEGNKCHARPIITTLHYYLVLRSLLMLEICSSFYSSAWKLRFLGFFFHCCCCFLWKSLKVTAIMIKLLPVVRQSKQIAGTAMQNPLIECQVRSEDHFWLYSSLFDFGPFFFCTQMQPILQITHKSSGWSVVLPQVTVKQRSVSPDMSAALLLTLQTQAVCAISLW